MEIRDGGEAQKIFAESSPLIFQMEQPLQYKMTATFYASL